MTNFYVSIVSLLTVGQLIHALPRTVTENYPRYTVINKQQERAFNPKSPAPFTSSVEYQEDAYGAATQQRSGNYAQNPYLYQNVIPVKQKPLQAERTSGKSGAQRFVNQEVREKDPKELEEEEIEEPDRLSLLLPQSKFACTDRNTGYYADEQLGCEVFHYCQDNARHSWICPEGFTFHQVHLICMPPGGDNICEKSSQFHFVNDYLYKPVNLDEYQQKPNVSLRYSERFYPQSYYEDRENDQEEVRQTVQHRNSVRVPQERAEQITRATFRPETTASQVFRSSNEVNIPLQQRRPQYVTQQFFQKK